MVKALGVMLMSAGRDALPHIEKVLSPPEDKTLAKRVADLIGRLDDESWPVRQKATADLKALGKGALPLLRKALEGKPSLEVRLRVNRILSQQEGAAAKRLRAGRARWVLQVIGGPKAAAMLKILPAPKRVTPARSVPPPAPRRFIIPEGVRIITGGAPASSSGLRRGQTTAALGTSNTKHFLYELL